MAEPRPFGEPWQAQVFALVVSLHEGGLFSWSEWAQSLSRQLKQPGTADDGSDYYECWLRALEELLKKHAIAADAEIGALQAAWQRAAHATPHGNPILLENDPDRSSA
jgi:nitrile hydratase accessory protein